MGADVASEMSFRSRWARTAHTLAELAFGYALAQAEANGEKLKYQSWQELEYEVFNQTTLEDFQ